MTVARVDCPSGASGNMFLGALLDAGLHEKELEAELRTLDLPPWHLRRRSVRKGPLTATLMDFELDEPDKGVAPGDAASMCGVIAASNVRPTAKSRAQDMIRHLATAEASVHGVHPDVVHFHELGSVDTVLDVTGACVAADMLNITSMSTSAINTGSGTVETSHGVLPVPAPATLELLEGSLLEVYSTEVAFELLTPTGALILASFTTHTGSSPVMRVTATGYGAGTADLPTPNVLRVTLGEASDAVATDVVTVVEANIDDMNPEYYPIVVDRLFDAGALDVSLTPIMMKKSRPGTLISVIVAPDKARMAVETLLRETTTLGVRLDDRRRFVVPRHTFRVATPYGIIQVKASYLDTILHDVAPEAEDCARAAREHNVHLQAVYDAARAAAWEVAPRTQPMEANPDA